MVEDRSEEAVAALNAALANNPRSFSNVYLVAEMLRKHGLHEQSRAAYARALHLAPAYLAGLEREQNYFEVFYALRRMALAHWRGGKEGNEAKVADIFAKMLAMPPVGEADIYKKIGDFMGLVGQADLQQRAYAIARTRSAQ